MIDTSFWKEFSMDILFDICAGKYYYSDEYEEGLTPYISASAENNGISQRINLEPDFEGNAIVTGKVGCTAFYQTEDFCATSDVNIFRAKKFKMNSKIGLFITSVLNFSENYKWGYGRQCRVGDSKKIYIKLPVELNDKGMPKIDNKKIYSQSGYIPDFKYMEEFIENLETLERESKRSIRNDLKTNNCKDTTIGNLDIINWKEFVLKDIFDEIYKAKAYVKGELNYFDYPKRNCISFITRTENNNACDCYIDKDEVVQIEKGNAIIIGDTTSTIFYQKNDFATGDHIVVCRANWINEYTALFFKTVLEKERYRYSYGRAFKKELIENTKVKLPISENGLIDFNFMERYIKQLPYGDKLAS